MALNFGQELFRGPTQEQTGFDAIDIATGRAVVVLYGGLVNDPDNYAYILSPQAFYSSKVATSVRDNTIVNSIQEEIFDITFPMVFQKAVHVDGKFIVNVPICIRDNTGDTDLEIELDIQIEHYDGSTTTVLDQGTLEIVKFDDIAANKYGSHVISGTFDVSKLFKPGEILQVGVQLNAESNAGGGPYDCSISFGHDPLNRATSQNDLAHGAVAGAGVDFSNEDDGYPSDSIFSCHMPVKVDFT